MHWKWTCQNFRWYRFCDGALLTFPTIIQDEVMWRCQGIRGRESQEPSVDQHAAAAWWLDTNLRRHRQVGLKYSHVGMGIFVVLMLGCGIVSHLEDWLLLLRPVYWGSELWKRLAAIGVSLVKRSSFNFWFLPCECLGLSFWKLYNVTRPWFRYD